VELSQIIFTICLVVILLAMAGYFLWRQVQTLRTLSALDPEERRFVRSQAWRRLVCSGLMVILAGLFAGSFYVEGAADQLAKQGEANREQGVKVPLDQEQARFFNVYRIYWGSFTLVLFIIIVLAGVDFMAIRRYGKRQLRQIREDRKAMLEGELARLRSQRNGHH